MSFANTNAALSKLASAQASTPEQKLAIDLAAALLELVRELEERLDELERKIDSVSS